MFSEVCQEKFDRKECPFIFECDVEITKNHFIHTCKTQSYSYCTHFATRVGELKAPVNWLQKMAVEHSKYIDMVNPGTEMRSKLGEDI